MSDDNENESILSVDDDVSDDDHYSAIYPGANMSSNINDSNVVDEISNTDHSVHSSRFLNNIYMQEQVLVGETVSDEIRDLIHSDKMIDFELLLSPNHRCPLDPDSDPKDKKNAKRHIVDISIWNRAYNTFTTVHVFTKT